MDVTFRSRPDPIENCNVEGQRRGLVLFLLSVVAVFNYVDRQIMAILLQPIQATFHASDMAMGFLTGLIFAGCYAIAAVPLAQMSDRGSRSRVLAGCILAWSLLTGLGGLAQTFWQLALTRIGVAVAESGAVPASHAIISDFYPHGSRARAIAMLSSAQSLGIGLGLALGGWLAHTFNWRVAFMVVGLPGVVLSLVLLLWLRAPPRGAAQPLTAAPEDPSFAATVRLLWAIPAYRYLVLTIAVASFPGYAMLAWAPTFLIRVHGMSMERTGAELGLCISGALISGSLIGGHVADRWGRGDIRRFLWIAAIGPVAGTPFLVSFTLLGTSPLLFVCLFLGQMLHTMHVAPCYALGQSLVPPNRRATASVFMGLASVVVGAGFGPFALGALNDTFAAAHGVLAIRWSLAVIMSMTALASLPALLAARAIRPDDVL